MPVFLVVELCPCSFLICFCPFSFCLCVCFILLSDCPYAFLCFFICYVCLSLSMFCVCYALFFCRYFFLFHSVCIKFCSCLSVCCSCLSFILSVLAVPCLVAAVCHLVSPSVLLRFTDYLFLCFFVLACLASMSLLVFLSLLPWFIVCSFPCVVPPLRLCSISPLAFGSRTNQLLRAQQSRGHLPNLALQ